MDKNSILSPASLVTASYLGAPLNINKQILKQNAKRLLNQIQNGYYGKNPTIDNQQDLFDQAKMRIDKEKLNIEEVLELQHNLIKRPIIGFKYNYALDDNV